MVKPERRVLMIEDEPGWQKLLKELLQEVATEIDCTIQIVLAQSFADALDSLKAMSYDCITIDNELQDIPTAPTLLDRIVSLDPRPPIIVVSGVVNPEEVRDFFQEYKIDEFFWKHRFRPKQFREKLTRLLGGTEDESSAGEEAPSVCNLRELAELLNTHSLRMDVDLLLNELIAQGYSRPEFQSFADLEGTNKLAKFLSILSVMKTYGEDGICHVCEIMKSIRSEDEELRRELNGLCPQQSG